MTEEFVPVKEIAGYFGVSTAAIYKYVKQGKINARRIGGAVRITRGEFDRVKLEGLHDTGTGNDAINKPRALVAV